MGMTWRDLRDRLMTMDENQLDLPVLLLSEVAYDNLTAYPDEVERLGTLREIARDANEDIVFKDTEGMKPKIYGPDQPALTTDY